MKILKGKTFYQRTFKVKVRLEARSLSGLLTVKGTGMREQGSLKGVGTHRRYLCVDAQIIPNPDVRIYSFIKGL